MHTVERSNFPTTGCASRRRVETLNRYILKSWQFGVRCSAFGFQFFFLSSDVCPLPSAPCPCRPLLADGKSSVSATLSLPCCGSLKEQKLDDIMSA